MNTAKRVIKSNEILMYPNHYLNVLEPEKCTLYREQLIESIAHSLARQCRFNGHSAEHYSVAQHSVITSHVVAKPLALYALLHDAAEAVTSDLHTPIKTMLPDFKRLEKPIEKVFLNIFGLSDTIPDEVKLADKIVLRTEQRDIMNAEDVVWAGLEDINPLPFRIKPMAFESAKKMFLKRFYELTE